MGLRSAEPASVRTTWLLEQQRGERGGGREQTKETKTHVSGPCLGFRLKQAEKERRKEKKKGKEEERKEGKDRTRSELQSQQVVESGFKCRR